MGCAPDDIIVLKGRDRLHGLPGEFNIVQCQSCGLMRTNPRPTRDTIGFYYPDVYGPHQEIRSNPNPGTIRRFVGKILRHSFEFNTERIPAIPPGRLFEVGCGSGGFLKAMSSDGWAVEALELASAPVRRLRNAGYLVHQSSLEAFEGPEIRPDLVVAWMVLEHLYAPIEGLKKIHSWLPKNGWMVLSVPNESALMAKIAGDAWYNRQLPTHLYHFSEKSVCQMLEKSGFKVEKILHQRILGSILATIGNMLEDRGILPVLSAFFKRHFSSPMLNYLLFPLGWALGIMGQTGRMTLWARKR